MKDIIKAYRLEKSLNQVQFAKLAGCSTATLCKIEKGSQKAGAKVLVDILKIIIPGFKDSYNLAEASAECVLTNKENQIMVMTAAGPRWMDV